MKYTCVNTLSIIAVLYCLFISSETIGQNSSFDQVYTILQTHCGGSACHSDDGTNPLKLVDSIKSVVYANIINTDPLNPYAKDSVGFKTVVPGSPNTSFLLRKVACNRGPETPMALAEGNCMPDSPQNNPSGLLSEADVDLIRVWIAGGAPDTGIVSGIFDFSVNEPVANVFPNPFGSAFFITFTLDQANQVKLELYDLPGKRIAILKEENMMAGDHRYHIKSPEQIPNGIYVLRMTVGNSVSALKITKIN